MIRQNTTTYAPNTSTITSKPSIIKQEFNISLTYKAKFAYDTGKITYDMGTSTLVCREISIVVGELALSWGEFTILY